MGVAGMKKLVVQHKPGAIADLCKNPFQAAPAPQREELHDRQTLADQKWEKAEWMDHADLAKTVRKKPNARTAAKIQATTNKRPREAFEDDDHVTPPTSARPPPPPDPPASKNPETRKRDQDVIPSPSMWVWNEATQTYDLQPRPRVVNLGPFFTYRRIPANQVSLLKFLTNLVDPERPGQKLITTEFMERHLVRRLNRDKDDGLLALRRLEWLVVDYAREKDVKYVYNMPGRGPVGVVVHAEHTRWSTRWGRRRLDPFRRRQRIYFEASDGETYSTTVAQVHFFYMAVMYGIVQYAEDHAQEIYDHMESTLKENAAHKTAAKKDKLPVKRTALVGKAESGSFLVSCNSASVISNAPFDSFIQLQREKRCRLEAAAGCDVDGDADAEEDEEDLALGTDENAPIEDMLPPVL